MKQRFKPYLDYQESGVAWIGGMPSHWDLQRTKTFFDRMQRPVQPKDGIVTAFRDGEVTLRSNRRTDGFTNAAKEIGYQGVRVDDLVVHAMDGFAGAIGVSDSDGKCSPVYSVCTAKQKGKVHVAYYGYLVRQLAVTDFISSLAKGIRERSTEFRYSEFSILELAVPPKEEQKQIAVFLDYETAKIDALIEKQQQLIALLGEKRQAVISHAVTQGLNPDAPMRDSGLEWLGDVPEHWDVRKLKHSATDIQTGPFGSLLHAEDYISGGVPLVNPAHMVDGKIVREDKCTVDDATQVRLVRHQLKEGDLVCARRGELGRCAVVRAEHDGWLCGTGSLRISFSTELSAEFACFLISSDGFKGELSLASRGSTMENLNPDTIGSVHVPVPPVKEQSQILKMIADMSQRLDSLESLAIAKSELLQERRTALISAAVTGNIDVRGWKPPASDANSETEMELA